METRPLGRHGPRLPVVGFGTWKVLDVRGTAAEARAAETVEAAFQSGVRVFDSSPMYGEAERVLGAALRAHRDDVFVATKVWASTPDEAERQIERALGFFGGRVDLYQVHNLRQLAYVLPRLRRLRSEGKVRFIGVTHYDPAAFADLARTLREEELDTVQLPLNVASRESESELLPLAAELGLGVLVMKPLATGELTAGRAGAPAPVEGGKEFGVLTRAQSLLKWVLSDPRVSVALPATREPAHVRENAGAGAGPWYPAGLRDALAATLRA